jgi:hypothetical protein
VLDADSDQPVNFFQGLKSFHEEGLLDDLPAHTYESRKRDPELLRLEAEITQSHGSDVSRARSAAARHWTKLHRLTLNKSRQPWSRSKT